MDLYETLGVSRGSDSKSVHAAYRRTSKRCHPDVGGDQAAFERARLARDVLIDPRRREQYDRTGKIEETQVDNAEAVIRQTVFGLFQASLSQVVQSGQDPERVDLVAMMRETARAKIAEHEASIESNRSGVDTLEKIAKRFRSAGRGRPNVMALLIRGHVGAVLGSMERVEAQLVTLRAAQETLEGVAYDYDPAQQFQQSWVVLG